MGILDLWIDRSIVISTGPILLEEMTLSKFVVASETTPQQAPPKLPEIPID